MKKMFCVLGFVVSSCVFLALILHFVFFSADLFERGLILFVMVIFAIWFVSKHD